VGHLRAELEVVDLCYRDSFRSKLNDMEATGGSSTRAEEAVSQFVLDDGFRSIRLLPLTGILITFVTTRVHDFNFNE